MSAAQIEIGTTDPSGTTYTINPRHFRIEIRLVKDQIEIRMVHKKPDATVEDDILIDPHLLTIPPPPC